MERTEGAKGMSELMKGLLESILDFMSRSGMARDEIQKCFDDCINLKPASSCGNRSQRASKVAYGCDTVAGAVLRAWHRNTMYLDAGARPVPLNISGKRPNLTNLILSLNPTADVSAVVRAMTHTGLLKKAKRGGYLPARESATIRAMHPLAVDHVAKTVMRLVETVNRNTATSRSRVPLIERYAHVPDLDSAEAKAFASFSKKQGQAYLDSIEDWLESRQKGRRLRSPDSGGASMNAGVHIFAYLGDSGARAPRTKNKKPAKRLTPPREARV